jgi:hypothetical protein
MRNMPERSGTQGGRSQERDTKESENMVVAPGFRDFWVFGSMTEVQDASERDSEQESDA